MSAPSSNTGAQYTPLESTSSPASTSDSTTSNTATPPTPVPAYTSTPILTEQDTYRRLDVSCGIFSNLILSTIPERHPDFTEVPSPVFYIKNNIHRELGPSVTLIDKDRHGETLGFANLRWGRADLFALGPCADFLTWRKLRRVSSTTHSRFEFDFDFGRTGGGRRKFIWRRQLGNIWGYQPDLVLHEIVGWGVYGAWGHESSETLAEFEGMRFGPWRRNGRLKIKRGVAGDDSLEDRGEKDDEPWGEWEKVVTLTAMAIVEASRRRSFNRSPDPKVSEASP